MLVEKFNKNGVIDVLKNIYTFRCLTLRQTYRIYVKYDNITIKEYITVVKNMLQSEFVKMMQYPTKTGSNYALFITNKGIGILKQASLIELEVYNPDTGKVKKGYNTEAALEMLPRLVNHQVHLNQFVIDFMNKIKSTNCYDYKNKPLEYYDEKFMSKYTCIRPDGMIQLDKVDLFLEMDMLSENFSQLKQKWINYRNFMRSIEYRNSKSKIIVLFIFPDDESIQDKIQNRINVVRKSLTDTIVDCFDDKFDIYIGTKTYLFGYLFNKLIPQINNTYFMESHVFDDILMKKHGFSGMSTKVCADLFNNVNYGRYIRKLNSNNRIPVENGKIQEFIFQESLYRPMSLVYRLSHLQRNANAFWNKNKRKIDYIVLIEDEETIYNDLKVSEIIGLPNIMFTTAKRLETMPFHEAVFTIDSIGIVRHFTDSGFRMLEYEKNIFEE